MKTTTLVFLCGWIAVEAHSDLLSSASRAAANDSSGKIDTLLPGGVCGGRVTILDSTFNDAVNEARGNWGGFSDYDLTRASTLATEGSSKVSIAYVAAVRGVSPGRVDVQTNLDKQVGGQWHKSAGWAGIQTGVCGDGNQLSGISFHIKVDTMPATVMGIRFRVVSIRDGDTASVFLPARALRTAGGSFCILPRNLRGANGAVGTGTTLSNIRYLMWEARIVDQGTASIATAMVQFSIDNVRLYDSFQFWVTSTNTNSGCNSGAIVPRLPSEPSLVSYSQGFLDLRDLTDIATLDVLALDGHRVATVAPSSRIPLRLSRGTWILAAHRRDGTVATQPFVVAGP